MKTQSNLKDTPLIIAGKKLIYKPTSRIYQQFLLNFFFSNLILIVNTDNKFQD